MPASERALAYLRRDVPIVDSPPLTNANQVSNVWNEFARGYFSFYITGPWNIGEFKRRLPADLQAELDDGAVAWT